MKTLIKLLMLNLLLISSESFADFEEERFCLAKNIYFEAGNQPFSGKLAVANVTMNRVSSEQFPDDVCSVVYQSKRWRVSEVTNALVPVKGSCQFSWFCDGKSDTPKDSITWLKAIRIAGMALTEKPVDITEGALWYHANYVCPYWASHLERIVRIENHIFYK